ncbi:DUF5123 domain-containing protein [Bremerella sp. T1]|uniref:DUF5123 domain-containing protein n=1 Tax=Bremerella sp. TYQ1 TaxID=3119568 RepID=UPI001CC97D4B|nr:DUF5123 domain-containing protein [Bremerella volcania]UBM36934.1 DUF5123 domain-containing protein [Bremerella volcania]
MKLHALVLIFACLSVHLCRAAETDADYYVSPQGSDGWSGTIATTNSQKSDGPFATIERARDAIRESRFSESGDCTFIDELPAQNSQSTEDRRALAQAKQANTDHNIYFSAADSQLGKQIIKKHKQEGIDAHSLSVDPLFVDPANVDFRFQPDSPALKLGIVPFDVSIAGLIKHIESPNAGCLSE